MHVGIDRAADTLVVLAAAIQGARIAVKPAVRREFSENARVMVPLAIAACAVGTALVWMALESPALRHLIAAGLAASMAAAWWRARPSYGWTRQLPPGSLGLGQSLDAIADERFYARATRRWGTLFKVSHFHRPVVCLVDLRLAIELLDTEHDAFRQVEWPFDRLVPGGYVEFMDGERHARFRELFRPGFGSAVLRECQASFERLVRDQLDALARHASPGGVDPEPVVERIGLACLLRVVLGVSPDDPRVQDIPKFLADLDRPIDPFIPIPARVRGAFQRLAATVRELGESAACGSIGAPLPSSVLGEVLRADGALVRDDAVIGNLVTMIHDGRTMLRRTLLWLLKLSGDHPRQVAQIGASAADDLARHFVLEMLRMHMTPYVYRQVVRDTRLGPYAVPRGWLLRICLREAHRRSDVFPEPDRFDPSRFAGRSVDPTEFCPFSHGPHACFAAEFVMAVGQTFSRQLAERFDTLVVQDGAVERGNRHWSYSRPSTRLRIALAPRRDGVTA